MSYDHRLMRYSPESITVSDQDVGFIRKEMMAILQETASVRASLVQISSRNPGVSRRYVMTLGAASLVVVAAALIYQVEVQSWVHRLGPLIFAARS